MVRTHRSPRCCCTSSVSVTGRSRTVYSTVKAFVIAGSEPVNATSTTGPSTCTIVPVFIRMPSSSIGLAAGNLQQLLRDGSLAQLVVVQRQVLDHRVRVVGGALHRHHACALFAGLGVEQHGVKEHVQVVTEQVTENGLSTRFEAELGCVARELFLWVGAR